MAKNTTAPLLTDEPMLSQERPPAAAVITRSSQVVAPEVPVHQTDANLVLLFERLARDPSVDVEKLQRLIDMQKDILRHNAESAFNVAFSALQAELPTIIERAETDKGTYAPIEDIIEPVRPILREHGFSISFRTEWPEKGTVKVVGILTHREGHSRHSEFIAAADQTGSKNTIQAFGSSIAYGRRYTIRDLLCIVTRGEDDDGERSTQKDTSDAPEGYGAWLSTLEGVTEDGMAPFAQAWNKSPEAFRNYLARTDRKLLASIKRKASRVGTVS